MQRAWSRSGTPLCGLITEEPLRDFLNLIPLIGGPGGFVSHWLCSVDPVGCTYSGKNDGPRVLRTLGCLETEFIPPQWQCSMSLILNYCSFLKNIYVQSLFWIHWITVIGVCGLGYVFEKSYPDTLTPQMIVFARVLALLTSLTEDLGPQTSPQSLLRLCFIAERRKRQICCCLFIVGT